MSGVVLEDSGAGGVEMDPLLTQDSFHGGRGMHRADSFYEHLGDHEDAPTDGISTFSTIVIAVNMIVGAGILGLPYAFYTSGAWLATGVLAVSTLLAGVTVGYLIECTGWCEGLSAANEADRMDSLIGLMDESAETLEDAPVEYNPRRFKIRNKKFEMSEMCGMLLASKGAEGAAGKQWYRKTFEFVLFSYTFGSCWLYASVFASTLSMLIQLPGQNGADITRCWDKCDAASAAQCGEFEGCVWADGGCGKEAGLESVCWLSYRLFLVVFFGVQILLSCAALHTFKNIQVFFSAWVFAAILIMVATSLFSAAADTPADDAYDRVPPFNPAKIVNIVSSGLFAQMCHQGVPSVVRMTKDKQQSKRVFYSSLAYTLVLYTLLGFSTSYHLGPATNPIITLNWNDFREASSHVKSIAVRVLLSFFPILCAAMLRDLVRILEFNGIFAFVIAFFTPCALQLAAFQAAKAKFGEHAAKNPYWDIFSAPNSVYVLLLISSLLFLVVGYQTVLDYLS